MRIVIAAILLAGCVAEGPEATSTTSQEAANYTGGRWPSTPIYYYIDDDGTAADKLQPNCGDKKTGTMYATDPDSIHDAIAQLEAQTPLVFHEVTGTLSYTGHPVMVFTRWNETYGFGTPPDLNLNTTLGQSAANYQNCMYLPADGFDMPGLEHEIGHMLGMQHEHQRFDADQFVVPDPTCVSSDLDGMIAPDGSASPVYTPYDFDSIMHYWSNEVYDDTISGCGGCTEASCDHVPLQRVDPDANGSRWIDRAMDLSPQDINTLTYWYEAPLEPTAQPYGGLGIAMATGDLDGDGYDDLAVGASAETIDTPWGWLASGEVFLYKGTEEGLSAWKTLSVRDFIGLRAEPHDYDRFGQALAIYDIDGNGADDLVVGAPGFRVGSTANAGAVFVYHGHDALGNRIGPDAYAWYTEASSGATLRASSFGSALAVGLADATHAYLAIGAPGEPSGMMTNVGTVFVVRLGNGTWQRLDEAATLQHPGDRFGNALVFTDIDGTANQDLVVGAPATGTTNSGRVVLFTGGSTFAAFGSPITDNTPEASEQFGASLAAGPVTCNGPLHDLVIGAPNKLSGTGRVFVYHRQTAGYDTANPRTLNGGGFGTPPVAGDHFGTSLAIGRMTDAVVNAFCYPSDLAIGAPGVDVGTHPNQGAAFLYKGGASDVTAWVRKVEHGDTFDASTCDGFGTAVGIGQFGDIHANVSEPNDDFADLAVGAPFRAAGATGAGAFEVFEGDEGTAETYSETYGQATASEGRLYWL